jgi:hypothetical protein
MSTLYYYAARKDDGKMPDMETGNFPWNVAKHWDIAFLIHHTHLEKGMWKHDDGKRYYVSHISDEDFDLLHAFGVECVTEFPAIYPNDGKKVRSS